MRQFLPNFYSLPLFKTIGNSGSVYNNIEAVHEKRNELNLALKNYEIGYEIH